MSKTRGKEGNEDVSVSELRRIHRLNEEAKVNQSYQKESDAQNEKLEESENALQAALQKVKDLEARLGINHEPINLKPKLKSHKAEARIKTMWQDACSKITSGAKEKNKNLLSNTNKSK